MSIIENSIEKCYMTHKYEYPGTENGMCAGLRVMNGQGEPCDECKECEIYYGYKDEHEQKMTNADRIRSMSDEEFAEFWLKSCDNPIMEFNEDICDLCDIYENESGEKCDDDYCKKAILKWLQSEVEE